jgi:hypothetical protein
VVKLLGHELTSSGSRSGDTLVWLLLEFCEESLLGAMRSALAARKTLSEREVLRVLHDVGRALAHMHSAQPPVAHRDVKVENVVRDGRSRCWKLIDFGSATTRTWQFTGAPAAVKQSALEEFEKRTTLEYRAPEMCDVYHDHRVDTAVDVWALGCMTFNLLYFRMPFEAASKLAILGGTYVTPDVPAYSPRLIALLHSMLRPEPARRPSMHAVLAAVCDLAGVPRPPELDGWVADAPVAAAPDVPAPPAVPLATAASASSRTIRAPSGGGGGGADDADDDFAALATSRRGLLGAGASPATRRVQEAAPPVMLLSAGSSGGHSAAPFLTQQSSGGTFSGAGGGDLFSFMTSSGAGAGAASSAGGGGGGGGGGSAGSLSSFGSFPGSPPPAAPPAFAASFRSSGLSSSGPSSGLSSPAAASSPALLGFHSPPPSARRGPDAAAAAAGASAGSALLAAFAPAPAAATPPTAASFSPFAATASAASDSFAFDPRGGGSSGALLATSAPAGGGGGGSHPPSFGDGFDLSAQFAFDDVPAAPPPLAASSGLRAPDARPAQRVERVGSIGGGHHLRSQSAPGAGVGAGVSALSLSAGALTLSAAGAPVPAWGVAGAGGGGAAGSSAVPISMFSSTRGVAWTGGGGGGGGGQLIAAHGWPTQQQPQHPHHPHHHHQQQQQYQHQHQYQQHQQPVSFGAPASHHVHGAASDAWPGPAVPPQQYFHSTPGFQAPPRGFF